MNIADSFIQQLSCYAQASDEAKEKILHELMGSIASQPPECMDVLDQICDPDYLRHEGYLILCALSMFMAEEVEQSLQLAQQVYDAGSRRAALFEVLARCLSEQDRCGEALALFEADLDVVENNQGLIKRVAGLYFIIGDLEKASHYARIVRSWCADDLLDYVVDSNDKREQRIYADEEGDDEAGIITDPYQDEIFQTKALLEYVEEANQGKTRYQAAIPYLNALFQQQTDRILSENPEITSIVNFGSLYGNMEYDLARRKPGINIFGYDRSSVSKDFNDRAFIAENLDYLSGPFEEAAGLIAAKGGGVLLCHGRTGTLMSPDQLADLYETCRKHGFLRLLIVEDVNFNLGKAEYPDFSRSDKKTLLMGGYLKLHDYPHYLKLCGYEAVRTNRRLYPFHFGRTINGDSMVTEIIEAKIIC